MKKFLGFVLALTLLAGTFAFGSCNGGKTSENTESSSDSEQEISSDENNKGLKLSNLAIAIDLFETKTVSATFENETVACTWGVENSEIATVENGVVSAKAKGETKISATYNGETVYCTVHVKDGGERPNLTLPQSAMTVKINTEYEVTPVVTYKSLPYNFANVTVTSSNANVVAEMKDGVIVFTGKSVGEATLTVEGTAGSYMFNPVTLTLTVIE